MDWLNYHHLLYFWTVAKEGSVAKATEQLHLAQPTISAQIHSLEKSLGQKLFSKKGRSLVLTERGQAVFRYADEIFSLGREMVQTLQGEGGTQPQKFSVGVSDSLPKLTTFRLLQPALALQPSFRFVIRTDKTERLLSDLHVHSLDIVLTDTPMPPSTKERIYNHLLGECGISIFGKANLAEEYAKDFPASLHLAPMVLQTTNTAIRHSLDQWFEAHSITPRIEGEVEDAALLQVLGQNGMGLFAAPSIVEKEICAQHHVQCLGRLTHVRERFYAVSVERRIKHPAVMAISNLARRHLFSTAS